MLEELIEILGHEATLKLVQRFGGTALYIPQNPQANHPLTLTIGEQGAALLSSYFGGENLYLPLGRKWARELQRERIHELRSSAVPLTEIAKSVGCTTRWVRMVLKDYSPNPINQPQPPL
ncbi:MAG: hypothetical protein A2508_10325 [Candidatus Lambdaproteobacteria bacterium RIFOXYD12_FULL_49_8]|uniref:Mor transcription activator domain-containing protein n=1 Tax=Candidatus Lambdaproteobacteria bacterium RIFOXYD2_FULL_50_16 TaxID=1817772 RepID=A0A1F6G643_9PROT|nr:MAG: hypothetical protein A2527_11760 [Candidatus Lambdaproteobacteria bacterium RIFOXYD2_FULL_50_16]OGG98421.1 MAG: hypothetical protein A2508_10325 [Candidatus Lambdaproteobacteria bacterium RIFOXYD12_FULL_49_8]